MTIVILRIAAALYAGAAAAYIVYFARPRHARAATIGFWFLAAAFGVQAVAIGVGCAEYGGADFFGLRGGLVLVVWFAAGAYLLLQRFYRLSTLGAFITPVVLIVLVPALFGDPHHPEPTTRCPRSRTCQGAAARPGSGRWRGRGRSGWRPPPRG